MAITKKKTSKKKVSKKTAPTSSSDDEVKREELLPPTPMESAPHMPDFLKADQCGQTSMIAWATAAGVQVPDQYLVGKADEVMRHEMVADIHQHWAVRNKYSLEYADMPWEQRALGICYARAVIVELKRQGFMTDVR